MTVLYVRNVSVLLSVYKNVLSMQSKHKQPMQNSAREEETPTVTNFFIQGSLN